jgi:CO dehydrogenase/acetyl-CoA synthase beta subunit
VGHDALSAGEVEQFKFETNQAAGGYRRLKRRAVILGGHVLDKPLPTGLYSELIVFYVPEEDGFGIVDRGYTEKTPVGLTFEEMEKIIVGRQVEGFVGVSFSYLKSKKFLNGEGGWKRVVWMSPGVGKFLKSEK